MMKSSTAGIGLRIDQDETFIMAWRLRCAAARAAARRGARRRRRVDDAHQVAVGEEAAARGDDARVGARARR